MQRKALARPAVHCYNSLGKACSEQCNAKPWPGLQRNDAMHSARLAASNATQSLGKACSPLLQATQQGLQRAMQRKALARPAAHCYNSHGKACSEQCNAKPWPGLQRTDAMHLASLAASNATQSLGQACSALMQCTFGGRRPFSTKSRQSGTGAAS
eukprot:611154-Pelagomonas_calceolata.AAC.2